MKFRVYRTVTDLVIIEAETAEDAIESALEIEDWSIAQTLDYEWEADPVNP